MKKIASYVEEELEKRGTKIRTYLFVSQAHLMPFDCKEIVNPRITGKTINLTYLEKRPTGILYIFQTPDNPPLYRHLFEIRVNVDGCEDVFKYCIIRDKPIEDNEPISTYLEEAHMVQIAYFHPEYTEIFKDLEEFYKREGFSEKQIQIIMAYRKGKISLKEVNL